MEFEVGEIYMITWLNGFQVIGKYKERRMFYNGNWSDWVECISAYSPNGIMGSWWSGAVNCIGNREHIERGDYTVVKLS